MYCTQCGVRLDDSARFCTSCGKPTGASSAVPPSTPPGDSAYAAGTTFAPKRLHRILAGKKIAGVCTGYADYFDMDITLMRLIWVGLLLIPPHLGLIAYIVSWAVLPKE
jgi:phage shock protein C